MKSVKLKVKFKAMNLAGDKLIDHLKDPVIYSVYAAFTLRESSNAFNIICDGMYDEIC